MNRYEQETESIDSEDDERFALYRRQCRLTGVAPKTWQEWTDAKQPVLCCAWFAHCWNDATKTRTHPTLGDVLICDRCDAKAERLS